MRMKRILICDFADYDLHKSFARNTHQYGAMRYFRIIGIVENGCFLLKQETAFLRLNHKFNDI